MRLQAPNSFTYNIFFTLKLNIIFFQNLFYLFPKKLRPRNAMLISQYQSNLRRTLPALRQLNDNLLQLNRLHLYPARLAFFLNFSNFIFFCHVFILKTSLLKISFRYYAITDSEVVVLTTRLVPL